MEIILLQDIDNLGLANSVVTVKAGYARNYLIPQGKAIVANTPNKNSLMVQIKQQEERAATLLQEQKATAEKLESNTIKIAAKAGTSGKIFGSVNAIQLVAAIKESLDIDLDKKGVKMPAEVKSLGNYTATVNLSKDVSCTVKFDVYDDSASA